MRLNTGLHAGVLILAAIVGLLLATPAVRADDLVSRSLLSRDATYKALTAEEQLKKLAELKTAKAEPSDLRILEREATYRYIHQESKGQATDELKACRMLVEANLVPEAVTAGEWTIYPYCAALVADPAWAGGARARIDLLTQGEKGHIIGFNRTLQIAEWVHLEHVCTATAGVPLKDRGLARLKALAELATSERSKDNFREFGVPSWIGNQAVTEHLIFSTEWAEMKPAERLTYLTNLITEYKIPWGLASELLLVARDVVRQDPAYMAATDDAGRKKAVAEFIRGQKYGDRMNGLLESMASGKVKRKGTGPEIDDLAGAVGPLTDPGAALLKLRDLLKTASVSSMDYDALAKNLIMHYVEGDPDKPLSPAAELAVIEPYRSGDKKSPLSIMDNQNFGNIDLLPLAGTIFGDPAYATATWLGRAKILDKVQAGYPIEFATLSEAHWVLTQFALASETANVAPAARGEAKLRILAQLRTTKVRAAFSDFSLQDIAKEAVTEHFSEHPVTGKAKFAQVLAWTNQKLIDRYMPRGLMAQAAVEMLEEDTAFNKADIAGKKARIDQMEKSKQIDWSTSNDLKRFFKVEK